MTDDERHSLRRLLGAYFNQDWADDYADEDSVIDGFFKDSEDEDLSPVARGLRQLLQTPDDVDLDKRFFSEFGCDYYPAGTPGQTTRSWLEHVAERFEQEIARRRNEATR